MLGDSHEYSDMITPFDSDEITALMLRELRLLLDLPDWRLSARWHGVYPVQPNNGVQFLYEPVSGVTIVIATGGCGMTMSFGLAEQRVAQRTPSKVGASV